MGADIVGWIDCPLQKGLGPNGFFWKLKLRSLRTAIETQVPVEERAECKLQFVGANREPREFNYQGILSELRDFSDGIPQCLNCPISGGERLGCYKYVNYPIDANFEKFVFDFFVENVETKDTICQQIYADVVSKMPSAGTPWHTQRGSAEHGGVAELPKPLKHSWGGMFSKKSMDSAQILMSLFISLDSAPMVVGYTNFWSELFDRAVDRGVRTPTLDQLYAVMQMYFALTPLALSDGASILIEG